MDKMVQAAEWSRPDGPSQGNGTMTQPTQPRGLLRKVDCIQLPVPDLEGGLAFYRDRLGHELVWRTETAAGLRLGDSDTELVLQTQRSQPEVDLLVGSVDQAATQVTRAGGRVVVEPFDIPVGRVAVVADPFGNPLTLLDLTRGRYRTDPDGNVTGVAAAAEASGSDEP
jgi:predicted enzyme related to lactoylglutathione lyase